MKHSLQRLRAEWAPSIPRELLAGAVATFALIPEVIAFSFVAGVDPAVGLFAFWWTLRAGQYEDPKGDAARILDDRFDAAP